MGKERVRLFPERGKRSRSSKGQMQLFCEFSVDECVGRTGIEHKVEGTGSVDRDGNDDYGLFCDPEFDLVWLLGRACREDGEAEGTGSKWKECAGETTGSHGAHLESRTFA